MKELEILFMIAGVSFLLLMTAWGRTYGWRKSLLAGFLRVAWCFPVLAAAFPVMTKEVLTKSLSLKTIHLLEDDSESMRDPVSREQAQAAMKRLEDACLHSGCRIESTKLSELSELVSQGFTPLAEGIKSWLPTTHQEPWVLVSDGGDSIPSQGWSLTGQQSAKSGLYGPGLLLASSHDEQDNIWLDIVGGPDFGFDQKPLEIELILHRRMKHMETDVTVQIQASSLGKNLSTLNVAFRPNEDQMTVRLPLPALPRGTHLIKITALPIGQEAAIWDNTVFKSIEVLPNTIGLLHLLGSPSWDGRFVRRYLKSEPKYDLISFFILRDPADIQLSNERDLSLIPFPVERLFNDELPNFRAVIVQNFSLSQFLDPGYQKNLVDFVLNGGGLLFIGGPRALREMDVSNSPLSSLLPFKIKNGSKRVRDPLFWEEQGSVPFDAQAKFKIELADPKPDKRKLASVYEEWRNLNLNLSQQQDFQGLHRLDKVELLEQGFTPLLKARLKDGSESLLAAASYPGKGRALWILSDSLWKLAMNPAEDSSREVYHAFLKSSMTWLLREEMQRPLWLQDLALQERGAETLWSIRVRGPAAKYLSESQGWNVRVCGQKVNLQSVERQMVSTDQWILQGSLQAHFASGYACEFQLDGQQPAFGLVKASLFGIIPEVFADKDMGGSFQRLTSLSQLTGAELLELKARESDRKIDEWIVAVTGTGTTLSQAEQRLKPDYYWVFRTWWGILLLLALPLEVLVRRWEALFGSRTEIRARTHSESRRV